MESSLPTTVVSRSGSHGGTESCESPFTRYQNKQADWMERKRGSLMVVATVIATLTFQIAINPPGGVWQADANSAPAPSTNTHKPGTSVFASDDSPHKLHYEMFILLCTISFSASLAVILLLICGFPLRNRFVLWLLVMVLCISLFCAAGAYAISISMILAPSDKLIYKITLYYARFWAVLFAFLCFIVICRFVFWLLSKLYRFVFWLLKKFS